jgi:hypothetical protein
VSWGAGNTVTISSADGSAFADSIQGGALGITGGSLYLASATHDSTVGGLSISGGDLSGAAGQTLTVAGDFDWESGTGSQSSIGNSNGGQLAIVQTGSHSFTIGGSGRDLLAAGSLDAGSNPITISNSDFTGSGGVLLSTTSTVTFTQSSYQNDRLGLTIRAGGFVTSGDVSAPMFGLHLTGGLWGIAGGTLTVPRLDTDSGSTLHIGSGAAVSIGGGTISGTVAGGTLTENGASTATIDSNATWSGSLAVRSGSVKVTGSPTVGGLSISGGDLWGAAGQTLTVAGDFDLESGTGSQSSINNSNGGQLAIVQTGSHSFTIGGSGRDLLAAGSLDAGSNPITISDSDFTGSGGVLLSTTSTVTFTQSSYQNDGLGLPIKAGGFITTTANPVSLPVYALLQTGGTTTVPSTQTFQSASFSLQGGTLQVDGAIGNGSGAITISGGLLSGSGTIESPLYNTGGTVAPGDSGPGCLTVTGNYYSQGSGGTLRIAANGSTNTGSDPEYSWLSVGGNVSLAGTLELAPNASYQSAAQNGDLLAILSYTGSLSGQFADVLASPAFAGIPVSADYSSGGVVDALVGSPTPPAPTVSGISPTAGPLVGGTTVTISGTNLSGATGVKFGGATASFTVNSDTQIAATAPAAGSAGSVAITVTTAGGTSATSSADQFTYVAAPTVSGISPQAGPLADGTAVTISGTNLSGATGVRFGGATASFTVIGDTEISATAPAAGSAGSVAITVTTAGGTSATSSADQFTYVAAPTVSGISPQAGPFAGGTTVTISGSGFSGATAVDFGTSRAASFAVVSDTQVTATSPAGAMGVIDVSVTAAGGTSATGSADLYTYVAAPSNTALPQISGSARRGQTLQASTGSWTNSPASYIYQWQDCNSAGTDAANIPGATGSSYTLAASDVGDTIRVLLIASGAGGTGTAVSQQTAVVLPPPPANAALPTITGTPHPGHSLTCQAGGWTDSPTDFAYQWLRDGTAIAGATAQSYAVQAADCGHALSCSVAASNAGGSSAPATSAPMAVPALPTCMALNNVTAKHGKKALLHFRVNDSGAASDTVTITIKHGAKTVKTILLKNVATNRTASCSFSVSFKKGSYTWSLRATGAAGTTSAWSATKRLTVK